MRLPFRSIAAAAFLLLAPVPAATGARTCAECYLGVYDDPEMTRTTGSVATFQIKSVYLGLTVGDGVALAAIDFEARYPSGFTVIDVTSFLNGASYEPHGDGVRVTLPECVSQSRVLFRVRVLALGAARDAVVQLSNAVGRACGGVPGEQWSLPAGCYVANPSGGRSPCATGLEPASWSAMKALFK